MIIRLNWDQRLLLSGRPPPEGGVYNRTAALDNRNYPGEGGRANILIDEEGKIELVKTYRISEIPDIEEIIRFIRSSK